MGFEEKETRTLVFTYGTLKRGFPNHCLLEDLFRTGDAIFVGVHRTVEKFPLVCGPFCVPFLLNIPGSGDRVWGELYRVSGRGLARLDELEGTSHGHYERLPVGIKEGDGAGVGVVEAEAYYGHRSFAAELWKKNEERGFCRYTEKEARGYVKRKDRPQNLSFLEQIRVFVS